MLNGPQIKQNIACSSTGFNSPSHGKQEQSRRKWEWPLPTWVFGRKQHKSAPESTEPPLHTASLFWKAEVYATSVSWPFLLFPPTVDSFFLFLFHSNPHGKISSHFIAEFGRKIMLILFKADLDTTSLFHKIIHWYIHDSELQAHSLRTVVFQSG